jgi:hypothetical protein
MLERTGSSGRELERGNMIRRFSHLAIGLVAILSLAFMAGPAGAASAAVIHGYGPGGGTARATVTVSIDFATGVITITIIGSQFAGGEKVILVVFSTGTNVGSTTTDASGNFTDTVALPAGLPAGTHTLVATGQTSGDTASTSFVLSQASGGAIAQSGGGTTPTATPTASTPSSSSLAFTGTDAAALAGVGGAALAVGGLLVLASRRRRNRNWA